MPPAAELYAENLALKARVGSLAEQIGGLEERVAVLLQQIAWFKRKLFGGGQSEKLTAVDAAQLQLALAELAEWTAPAAKTETISYERAKPAPHKRPVPAETFARLPVKETIASPRRCWRSRWPSSRSAKSAPLNSMSYCPPSSSASSCARNIAARMIAPCRR